MNITHKDRLIEVTSYGELALATMDTDCAHPVFSHMFIEIEIAEEGRTIFAKRRKRSSSDPEIHIAHFVTDIMRIFKKQKLKQITHCLLVEDDPFINLLLLIKILVLAKAKVMFLILLFHSDAI
ncbi:hypothetical protein HNQ69_000959 [Bartonella callosciuri]|uniref:Glycosyl hydrolase 94 supersandwich domain-containing protein n=1 Tax=Bartonella callosciuri TaxID=686223 RepID=A0A840NV70_9HYPH|nr:hypothetical protein [Bartonella callosciuri]